jgi:hypothetical protein
MSYSWLSQVSEATEPHHIRAIFFKHFPFIKEPEVHNVFFERIDFLRKRSVNAQQVRDFDDLKEDIELEIEFGAMLRNLNKHSRDGKELTPEEKFYSAMESKRAEFQNIKITDGLLNSDEDLSTKRGLWAKVEMELTLKVLEDCKGNRTQTARALGVSIRTLRNKLNFYARAVKRLPEGSYMGNKAKMLQFINTEEISKH